MDFHCRHRSGSGVDPLMSPHRAAQAFRKISAQPVKCETVGGGHHFMYLNMLP